MLEKLALFAHPTKPVRTYRVCGKCTQLGTGMADLLTLHFMTGCPSLARDQRA